MFKNGKWRQSLHIEPPAGWLNDPNGLSWYNGSYHVYFQYGPDDARGGGRRGWGHYQSPDLVNWEFTGMVLEPDTPEDRSGAYSGCAVPGEDRLDIFYTGNVKEPGAHDYILSGRGANVIHVSTADGHTMSDKEVLLRNGDYPEWCSCHVRDPKVWRDEGTGTWHMVLGARTRDDRGCVLLYNSDNGLRWEYGGALYVPDYGYMWECPDLFEVDGARLLSISPQGLEHGRCTNQNVYSSGYFRVYDEAAEGLAVTAKAGINSDAITAHRSEGSAVTAKDLSQAAAVIKAPDSASEAAGIPESRAAVANIQGTNVVTQKIPESPTVTAKVIACTAVDPGGPDESLVTGIILRDFREWDYGFDFYAPQTFKAPDGRRILIGWMGIGDIPYSNPTAGLGWQHCLTVPREISVDAEGCVVQRPVRELESLRGEPLKAVAAEGAAAGSVSAAEERAAGHGIAAEREATGNVTATVERAADKATAAAGETAGKETMAAERAAGNVTTVAERVADNSISVVGEDTYSGTSWTRSLEVTLPFELEATAGYAACSTSTAAAPGTTAADTPTTDTLLTDALSDTPSEGAAFSLMIGSYVVISYDGHELELRFTDEEAGAGRTVRRMELPACRDLRIIADHSSLEIFADGGRGVMSTRFYPVNDRARIMACGLELTAYPLRPMEFKIRD